MIFGHLHKRHNLTKFGSKLILETIHKSQGKRETSSLGSAHTRRPSHAQRAPELAAHQTKRSVTRGPRANVAQARETADAAGEKCDLSPELTTIYTTKLVTIPADHSYARTPSSFPILASGSSPTPLRMSARR
jgi:hypothetical protein